MVKGGVMAKVVNVDKFSNWSWWIGVSPGYKSTVFMRPAFHISVWMYIALSNIFYFIVYYRGKGLVKLTVLKRMEYRTWTNSR